MSLYKEILENRAKVKLVFDRLVESSEAAMPKIPSELPYGFYKKQDQHERFLKSDSLITATIEKFMAEIGIPDYRLVREFLLKERVLDLTNMVYKIGFGDYAVSNCIRSGCLSCEKESEYDWIQSSSFRHNSFYYGPGKNTKSELLVIRHARILAPNTKHDHNKWLEAKEALRYLRSPNSIFLVNPHVFVFGVTEESIRDILTVILSDPNLKIDFSRSRGYTGSGSDEEQYA